jgi:translation initiation factor IF-1
MPTATGPGRRRAYRGVVVEQLPDALFSVRLDESNQRVVAHMDGAPRRNFVRLLPGDRVTVELTSRNRTRARITRRVSDHRDDGPGE